MTAVTDGTLTPGEPAQGPLPPGYDVGGGDLAASVRPMTPRRFLPLWIIPVELNIFRHTVRSAPLHDEHQPR